VAIGSGLRIMINLSDAPVIDSHCHGFLPEEGLGSFEQYLNLTSKHIPKEDLIHTFIYRMVLRELSRVLDFNGTHDEIIDERNKLYECNPFDYTKLLFEDAKIEKMLVDTGYPSKEFSGYSINLRDFSEIVPCEVSQIFRIDNIVYGLIKDRVPFEAAIDQFHSSVKEAVKSGAVSLKTVIAYTSGLEIKRQQEGRVREAYKFLVDEARSGKSLRDIFYNGSDRVKTVMDFIVILGVEDSIELGVPIQFHAGLGNPSIINVRQENPLLLNDLISDEKLGEAKIVLTHGGYPYVEEAGFIASANPNIFIDFSAISPFTSIGVKEKLLNLFEMSPTNKIMYGSDGHKIPELFWISAKITKKALSSALCELLKSNEIDEEWGMEIARNILSENARRIYNL